MPDGFFTAADGVRLYWRSIGDGPVVVIPNGLYFLDDLAPLAERRTLLAYDPRNRGRSDAVEEPAALGIEQDVRDLEAVRAALGIERVATIGHSYAGFLVGLHAVRHPQRSERLVMIGPSGPFPRREYPPGLRWDDGVAAGIFARIGELQRALAEAEPQERCERFWEVLGGLYVADPIHAELIRWGRCDLPNERAALRYWNGVMLPSIQRVELTAADVAAVTSPALVVHGRCDRAAPYGGGADWAALLPQCRLVTVAEAGHAPWLEAPAVVLPAIDRFLAGSG
jgi:proline iminopeptidase